MTNERRPSTGEVVGRYITEEAVYLKVAVNDHAGRHLGWAGNVKVDLDALEYLVRAVKARREEIAQLELPFDTPESNLRWLPPQP